MNEPLHARGPSLGLVQRLQRLLRHRWMDERDSRKAVPPDVLARLAARVAASEARHTGEVRICVEASLPVKCLWRSDATPRIVRERAVELFGKLGVWDTEHNNGVLIYLLLAEHAIEIVADRGLNGRVSDVDWQMIVARMRNAFQGDRFEDGLTDALAEVSGLLVKHFAIAVGADGRSAHNPDELPNEPVVF